MDTVENIAILREQVAQTEAKVAELKSALDAKEVVIAEMETQHVKLDAKGQPVFEDGIDRCIPKLERKASSTQIELDYTELGKIKTAYKEADGRLSALRRALAEAEKRHSQVAVEQLEGELQELIAQDAALYDQIEACILDLRAALAQWNDHLDAKVALRSQLRAQGEPRTDAGMLGKADARWNAWLTADFADDAALARQFGLLARGEGHMNPLPSAFNRAFTQAANEKDARRKATEPKSGYRRATFA